MDSKRPRKLDLNAPLMSARRLAAFTNAGNKSSTQLQSALGDTSNMIPFSWEQAPGKPKESERSNNNTEAYTPRPKLPPNRSWYQNKPAAASNSANNHRMLDNGCNGDVDDCNADLSDSAEMFSLTEAIDIVEKEEKEGHGFDAHNLEMIESARENQSPNYIIKRFLLDAEALAASSPVTLSTNWNNEDHDCGNYSSETSLGSSPKGCGLEILFPWRIKHKLCGVKSPVKHSHYHQSNAKQKKKVIR